MPNKNNRKSNKPKSTAVLTTKLTVANADSNSGRPRRKTRRRQRKTPSNVPPYVVALVDPFNPMAFTAKVPDAEMAISSTCYSRTTDAAVTDATHGVAALAFFPDPNNYLITAASVATATSWTWALNWTPQANVPNLAAIQGAFSSLRAIAYGLRITTPQSYYVAQGRVHVCLVSIDYARATLNDALPQNLANMQMQPGYFHVPLADLIKDSLVVIGKPSDSGAYRYRSAAHAWNIGLAAIAAGLESTTGWMSIVVALEGCVPNTTVLNIESIMHYEAIVLAHTGAGIIEPTLACPHQPAVMAASQNLIASMPAARVVDEEEAEERDLWTDLSKMWDAGVKVASGVSSAIGWMEGIAALFL